MAFSKAECIYLLARNNSQAQSDSNLVTLLLFDTGAQQQTNTQAATNGWTADNHVLLRDKLL